MTQITPLSSSDSWIGVRQATLVAIFLAYLMNFTLQWMARKTHQQKISMRIRNIHFKVFVFGFTALFGCNLVQAGIYQALVAWGIFSCLLIQHYMSFKDTDAKKRAIADCAFYAFIVAWLIGIIAHYAYGNQ